ncbi:hypothetical protein [Kineosporia sp. A_224]|uniref:hypothetical protein n=1 Tax=Kineosporia sp. A_224 TaxID=1962180 RepID=UPI00117A7DC9|nr:hypothetical protein [Kineosporia sp. A_224]
MSIIKESARKLFAAHRSTVLACAVFVTLLILLTVATAILTDLYVGSKERLSEREAAKERLAASEENLRSHVTSHLSGVRVAIAMNQKARQYQISVKVPIATDQPLFHDLLDGETQLSSDMVKLVAPQGFSFVGRGSLSLPAGAQVAEWKIVGSASLANFVSERGSAAKIEIGSENAKSVIAGPVTYEVDVRASNPGGANIEVGGSAEVVQLSSLNAVLLLPAGETATLGIPVSQFDAGTYSDDAYVLGFNWNDLKSGLRWAALFVLSLPLAMQIMDVKGRKRRVVGLVAAGLAALPIACLIAANQDGDLLWAAAPALWGMVWWASLTYFRRMASHHGRREKIWVAVTLSLLVAGSFAANGWPDLALFGTRLSILVAVGSLLSLFAAILTDYASGGMSITARWGWAIPALAVGGAFWIAEQSVDGWLFYAAILLFIALPSAAILGLVGVPLRRAKWFGPVAVLILATPLDFLSRFSTDDLFIDERSLMALGHLGLAAGVLLAIAKCAKTNTPEGVWSVGVCVAGVAILTSMPTDYSVGPFSLVVLVGGLLAVLRWGASGSRSLSHLYALSREDLRRSVLGLSVGRSLTRALAEAPRRAQAKLTTGDAAPEELLKMARALDATVVSEDVANERARALGSAAAGSPRQNATVGSGIGLLCGLPVLVLEFWAAGRFVEGSLAVVLVTLLYLLRWAFYGALYGYFYVRLRGNAPLSKSIFLLAAVVAAEEVRLWESFHIFEVWEIYAVHAAAVVVTFLLLGMAWENLIARRSGLSWVTIRDFSRFRSFAVPVATAILTAAVTLGASAAQQYIDSVIQPRSAGSAASSPAK